MVDLSERVVEVAYAVSVALPAAMQSAFGPSVIVGAQASDSIGDVKAKVEALTGVPPSELEVSYGGAPLTDDSATLKALGVPNGGSLDGSASVVSSVSLMECTRLLLDLAAASDWLPTCLLYTSPSPRDQRGSRMPSSA